MTSRFQSAIAVLACAAYLFLGFGGALPMGFCFEADGHVEIELMRAGSCTSSLGLLDADHSETHSEHAGLSGPEKDHCASCEDVLVSLKSLGKKRTGETRRFPATVRTPAIPVTHSLSLSSMNKSGNSLFSQASLSRRSAVVLRT
ncbi:MAG: hypothetical protein AB1405_09710 [Bdellovibrionota bacterium]